MYKLIEEVVLRPKKSSLLSGNRPGEKLLTHPHSQIWIRIYVFNFKKQAKKERKNKNTKKEKETKEKREYLRKIDRKNLRPPG